MKDIDQIYQLFAEANPAPTTSVLMTERPDADVILQEKRKPTMITQEPKALRPQPSSPQQRRWRGPAIAGATFLIAATFGIAAWLIASNDDPDSAAPPTVPSTTTTTLPPTDIIPAIVSVPDLQGRTLADARQLLADEGLEIQVSGSDLDSAIVFAQEPAAGLEVEEGTVVILDVRTAATCNPPDPVAPGVGQVIITVFFECDGDLQYPQIETGVARVVPEQGGEAIDRIEWTLRSLLAGPTADERDVGIYSFFDDATAGALNSVTLTDGRLVADFNDAILVNNASTSTGGLYFNAELRANMFQHPEVDSVEFQVNGDCEAWSAFFQSDGCWVITRAEWDQTTAEWDNLRSS